MKRFTRNGPNSTLQIDDNKNIVSTPDGEIDQSKNTFIVIFGLFFCHEKQSCPGIYHLKGLSINLTSVFNMLNFVFIREEINWKKGFLSGIAQIMEGGGATHARIFWPSF